ncbi:IS1595 family transposase [Parablastomonas sp. CN1-191]|uniref:IS1595 family transposase n=1 Tax=Parablastomonas sp. CN1-191 TaxID=3400908 RepID=UPI003BF8AED3
MSALSRPEFHSEEAAFAHLEKIVWADGMVCPHCGAMDRLTSVKANPAKRIRIGLHRCGHCKGQFTVKVGTVFEHMRLPLHKAMQAVYLVTSSKKGISAHQLHRTLEITYKSAWFLLHRIREAMTSGDMSPFGADGGPVEVDETFLGHKKGAQVRRGYEHKMKVVALVERNTGQTRMMVVDKLNIATVTEIVRNNVAAEAHLMTDEAPHYTKVGREFAKHDIVRHTAGEYGRGDVTTNTIEGSFSIFKRGMRGIYQHCGEQHLHRYLAEFEFRYNNRAALGCNDTDRSVAALAGIVGKRLTYAGPDGRA